MATSADPLELRYLAADYSRLIGLRAVPFGIALFLFWPIWSLPHRGSFAFLIPLSGGLALVGTLAVHDWYKRHYGSATAQAGSRRQGFWLIVVATGILGAVFLVHPPLASPEWSFGLAMLILCLPLQGGGWRRIRWHFVVAGGVMIAVATTPFQVASSLGGGVIVVLGLVDHHLFVRRLRSKSGETV